MLNTDTITALIAGDLPSTRTTHMLHEAMASNDIDDVKAQVFHVWCHYQALELMLADEADNIESLQETVDTYNLGNEDPFAVAARVYGTGMILGAYALAHEIGRQYMETHTPISVLFNMAFPDLDFVPSNETADAAHATPEDFAD